MHRAFQTAIALHKPDAVFFLGAFFYCIFKKIRFIALGDLFDEGQWASAEQFAIYAERFESLFYLPSHIKRYAAMGNHDVGFHYALASIA